MNEVTAAISVKLMDWQGGFPVQQHFVYGAAVQGFVSGPATQRGLATGAAPSNTETDDMSTPFGCFVPGTSVHLRDGTTVAIEQVCAADEILGHEGEVGVHSDEHVVVPLPDGGTVHGFNDLDPFVSAGHLLMTTEGWKAISPATALEENADRPVGQLRVGDRLLRLRSTDPVAYDEVVIERITSAALPAGSQRHGLHLHGARSYHADGFCVGMNYPVLTERRLVEGFASLSDAERRLVGRHLAAIEPFLERAVGRWVTAPLQRSLSSTQDG
jgi:hypothetical protein